MSKASLKKELKNYSRQELTDLIIELYDRQKESREFLEYWLNPDIDKYIEKTKLAIDKIFATSTGTLRKNPKLAELKDIAKKFAVMVPDAELVSEIKVYSVEKYERWLTDKKELRKTYVMKLKNFIDTTIETVESHDLNQIFEVRLEQLKERYNKIVDAHERIGKLSTRQQRWFIW